MSAQPNPGTRWREKARPGRIVEVLPQEYPSDRVLIRTLTSHNERAQAFPSLVLVKTFFSRFEMSRDRANQRVVYACRIMVTHEMLGDVAYPLALIRSIKRTLTIYAERERGPLGGWERGVFRVESRVEPSPFRPGETLNVFVYEIRRAR